MAVPEDFSPEFFKRNGIKTIQVAIDTLHCNARCEFCYLPPVLQRMKGLVPAPLHIDQKAMELMDAFVIGFAKSRQNVRESTPPVEILGGEITMYPHNLDMIRGWWEKAPNLRFTVVTNGLLFNKNWADFVVASRSEVTFSMNAYDQDSHEDRMKIRGFSFDKVVSNLKYIIEKSTTVVQVSFVMSPKTVREHYYSKIAQFLKREFFDQGITNMNVLLVPNLNPDENSFEGTFNADAYDKDEALTQDFIDNEVPILLELGLLENPNNFRVLYCLKASEEQIEWVRSRLRGQEWPHTEEDYLPTQTDLAHYHEDKSIQYLENLKIALANLMED